MATPWGSPDHTLPGRWARGYATAGGALAVGVLVGGVVGLVGAQTCTAEGFACLGWLVGGLGLGILLAVVLFVWGGLRAGLGVGHLLLLLVGWGALAVVASRVDNASPLFVVLGALWPLAALYPSPTGDPSSAADPSPTGAADGAAPRGRPGGSSARTLLVVALGVVVIATGSLVATWRSEQGLVDSLRESLAEPKVTLHTPADDAAYEWEFVMASPVDEGVSYALRDDDGRYGNVRIVRGGTGRDALMARRIGDDVVRSTSSGPVDWTTRSV